MKSNFAINGFKCVGVRCKFNLMARVAGAGGRRARRPALGGIREAPRGPRWESPSAVRRQAQPRPRGPTFTGAALSPTPCGPQAHSTATAHVPSRATTRRPADAGPHPLSQSKIQTSVSTFPLHKEPSTLIPEPKCPCVPSSPTSGPLHGLFPLPIFPCGSVLGLCPPPSVFPHFPSTCCMPVLRLPPGCPPANQSKHSVPQTNDNGRRGGGLGVPLASRGQQCQRPGLGGGKR